MVSQGSSVYHAICLDIPVGKGINPTAIREGFKNNASKEKVSDLFEYNYSQSSNKNLRNEGQGLYRNPGELLAQNSLPEISK